MDVGDTLARSQSGRVSVRGRAREGAKGIGQPRLCSSPADNGCTRRVHGPWRAASVAPAGIGLRTSAKRCNGGLWPTRGGGTRGTHLKQSHRLAKCIAERLLYIARLAHMYLHIQHSTTMGQSSNASKLDTHLVEAPRDRHHDSAARVGQERSYAFAHTPETIISYRHRERDHCHAPLTIQPRQLIADLGQFPP